jgi:hypothetical protein
VVSGLVAGPMSICHACGDDLRAALPLAIPILDQKSFLQTVEFLKSLESNHRGSSRFGFSFHAILHQQCRLILSERAAPRFREFIRERLNCPEVQLVRGRASLETRTIIERHHVVANGNVDYVGLAETVDVGLGVESCKIQRFTQRFGQPSSTIYFLRPAVQSKPELKANTITRTGPEKNLRYYGPLRRVEQPLSNLAESRHGEICLSPKGWA